MLLDLPPVVLMLAAGVLGLCVGSFLNVVIHRLPRMLEAAPLPSAEDWCEDLEVPMRQATSEEYWAHPEGNLTVEWIDEKGPPAT